MKGQALLLLILCSMGLIINNQLIISQANDSAINNLNHNSQITINVDNGFGKDQLITNLTIMSNISFNLPFINNKINFQFPDKTDYKYVQTNPNFNETSISYFTIQKIILQNLTISNAYTQSQQFNLQNITLSPNQLQFQKEIDYNASYFINSGINNFYYIEQLTGLVQENYSYYDNLYAPDNSSSLIWGKFSNQNGLNDWNFTIPLNQANSYINSNYQKTVQATQEINNLIWIFWSFSPFIIAILIGLIIALVIILKRKK